MLWGHGMKVIRLTVGGLADVRREKAALAVETRFIVRSQQKP